MGQLGESLGFKSNEIRRYLKKKENRNALSLIEIYWFEFLGWGIMGV